ncbi:unnamed protein product [Thlaspi arvense]|uniref:Uncharacterized protein n=1 Tax=Thlaspi arvense TaxID=13288 RepID=A0AAU9RX43_THLAR|nr:unnamed protein product [Thlaspi arvense]
MANMNARKQMIFPDENAQIHRKKSVTAASVKPRGTVLGQKKPGARKALNDITNKSGIHPKASSKNKQIASSAATAKAQFNIAGEGFLHDHSKCIKEQRNLWDDHFSADLLLHNDSSTKAKHHEYDFEMFRNLEMAPFCEFILCVCVFWFQMDAKNSLTYDEAEEIPSPELTSWLKSSTPRRSPVRHGSMMMHFTPLAWRFDSVEFKLKEEDNDDDVLF